MLYKYNHRGTQKLICSSSTKQINAHHFILVYSPRASIGCSAEPLTRSFIALLSYIHCLFTNIHIPNRPNNIIQLAKLLIRSATTPHQLFYVSIRSLRHMITIFPLGSFSALYICGSCFFLVRKGAKCCVQEKNTISSTLPVDPFEQCRRAQATTNHPCTFPALHMPNNCDCCVNPKPLSRFSF